MLRYLDAGLVGYVNSVKELHKTIQKELDKRLVK